MRDRGFSSPSEPVEPEDGRLPEILGPAFNLVQHAFPSSLEAAVPVPVSVPRSMCTTTTVQNRQFGFETYKLASFRFTQNESNLLSVGLSETLAKNALVTHDMLKILIIHGLLLCRLIRLSQCEIVGAVRGSHSLGIQ